MLTANRFTRIPTRNCRQRLERAMNNQSPIGRRERNRAAVVAIQTALADLNSDYLLVEQIDGYYGSNTARGVEAFQRDYGLVADGFVGQQTMQQLNELFNEEVIRPPMGFSIHVGVDYLDESHYGNRFELNSCVNDARKMEEIAESLGYQTEVLTNEEATTGNFIAFMRNAADNLFDGDSLMVTFSGHGSQIANTAGDDDEDDNRDETLCFYDRMLLDDEVYSLLGDLKEGVRVHMVFDSCHSGSVAKFLKTVAISRKDYKDILVKDISTLSSFDADNDDDSLMPITSKGINAALDGDKPTFAKSMTDTSETDQETAALFADLFDAEVNGPSKSVTFMNHIYDSNKQLYDAVKGLVGSKEDRQIHCSVITLSACQDSQTTPAGPVFSFFTSNIVNNWQNGSFEGSYRQFNRALRNASYPDVTPDLNRYGSNRAFARLYDRPFVI